jgi:hypothetical protein
MQSKAESKVISSAAAEMLREIADEGNRKIESNSPDIQQLDDKRFVFS